MLTQIGSGTMVPTNALANFETLVPTGALASGELMRHEPTGDKV